MKRFPLILIASSAVALSGCGGGGGGGSTATQQSAAGVWQASTTVASGANAGDTIQSMVLVAPNGQYYTAAKNQTNGCASVGFGQANVNGSAISGSGIGAVVTYTNIPGVSVNCSFPDGSTSGTVNFTGTVSTGQSLTITSTGITSAGTTIPASTDTSQWSSLNAISPSISELAGNYQTSTGSVISISQTGAVSGTDSTTGCSLNGMISASDATHNIYYFSAQNSGCSSTYSSMNGATWNGLASFNSSTNPNLLYLGASAKVSNVSLVIAQSLVKQ